MTTSPPPPPSVDELRPLGCFGGLTDASLELLTELASVQLEGPGTELFREGEAGREMFVLLAGELEVLRRSRHGTPARVALLGPGDWFGEMSLIDVQPRSATVRTLAPSRVLVVSSAALDALYRQDVKAYTLIILNLARELSRRLRVADGIVADFIGRVTEDYLKRR